MTLLKHVLLWSAVITYALLLFWWVLFACAHDWFYRLHQRWFRFSAETFDALNWGGIAAYKLGIIFFNLVPLVALSCAGAT
jgi:hypothetical protein